MILLEEATIKDAEAIHQLQVESFRPLLEKYQDFDTNPANEGVERIVERFQESFTTYYFILLDDVRIGAIRLVHWKDRDRARISPIFILPQYQGKGHGQQAMALIEEQTNAATWELDTIMQEEGNCYLYEKLGYKRVGPTKEINANMTIVHYEK